jgi:hypothetical protein
MRLTLLALLGCMATPVPAVADQSAMRFDVRVLGLHAGVIDIAARQTDSAYAARTRFRTAGLVGVLKRIRADVSVQGRVVRGRLKPRAYSEAIDDGRTVTDVEVRFAPGRPRLVSGDTGSSAPPADTARLADAIDPLTLLYRVLREQPRDAVCRFSADIFDGHRHAEISLEERQDRGAAITCNGHYRRVSGYGDDDSETRNVSITLEYVPNGDGMRAERVEFDTRLGPAVMERR